MRRIRRSSLAAAAVCAVIVFLFVSMGWLPQLELGAQDALYQQPGRADPNIKIIAIDEKTLGALGQFENWTREPYARLLSLLNREGNAPKVIGLDLLMINEKGPEDALLVQACRDYPNVVLATNLVFSREIEGGAGDYWVDAQHIARVEEPFAALKPYVNQGFVNTSLDSRDDHVRWVPLQKESYISFAAAVALQADPALVLPGEGMLLDYCGGPGSYETLSMIDVLEGRVPAAAFRNSIVLVGVCAAGMGDSYLVPTGRGAMMYGVEIHANILQGLLEGRRLRQMEPMMNGLLLGAVAFVLTLGLSVAPLWAGAAVSAALLVLQLLVCRWLDGQGLIVHLTGLPLACLLAITWTVAGKYMTEALQKRRILGAFEKYVAPQVVAELAKNPDFQLKLGGERRHIAVLFVDIRDFTPLCESLEPEQVVEILNEYLQLVTQAIFRQGGTLDKFIGDAAMAVFNAPVDTKDYVYRAVCAAREIAAGSEVLAQRFWERYHKRVSYGIGVHCGWATVGNIGSEFRMDYTAIGDTVNTAARLESNAEPGEILISKSVYEAVKDRCTASLLGEIPLKGKREMVPVYRLEG